MNLEAFVLGCGGMMPLPYRHLTSLLVRREGELFLFDCGEATQISIRRLNLRWKNITAVFISHMHADHVTGLPGILMLSSQVDRDQPLYIFGPPKIAEFVEQTRRSLDMYVNYEIIVREFTQGSALWETEEFSIRSFPLRHTKPCYGYALEERPRPGAFHPERALELGVPMGPLWSALQGGQELTLEDGRSVKPSDVLGPPRSGRKITYLTDSLYLPEAAAEASGSDLFICEGMFEEALLASAQEKRHMTARQAALLARAAGGVKKLGLIHYSPRYADKELKILLEEAREVFPDTVLTRDRMVFPLEHRD
ncbi:MAG TPA: ribonuclease Z [Rectinemataceae bacterium]